MKVELHIIQNFAPSSLNRDDSGSPKDCELGGVKRARISSQCFKRAIREAFVAHQLLDESERTVRTKRLVGDVTERAMRLLAGPSEEQVRNVVIKALGGVKLKTKDDESFKTEYLLFLPSRVIAELAKLAADNLQALTQPAEAAQTEEPKEGKRATKKQGKAAAKDEVPAELRKQIEALLSNGSRAPELALFGRMIADQPSWNIDAACQVAHAVSTHRATTEFDFYTAIDDLKKEDSAGSDMMGTISFNSACFYRYLVVDVDALEKNLGADANAREQARRTLRAFVEAAVVAIPSGKQNSMAAHNPPTLVLADVRQAGFPRSLANAFVDPVFPRRSDHGDLVGQSVVRLGKYLAVLDGMYGADGRRALPYLLGDLDQTLDGAFRDALGPAGATGAGQARAVRAGSLKDLAARVTAAAFGGDAA